MRLTGTILVAVAFVMPLYSNADDCLHYQGLPVTLTGIVSLQTFYGPPNYGENPETDSRETQAILKLEKPICVGANPSSYEDEERNQDEVTLVPPKGVNFGIYAGKKVSLQGSLFHAHTGHHHTPVLMQVVLIEANG